jgi:hypothetical protein
MERNAALFIVDLDYCMDERCAVFPYFPVCPISFLFWGMDQTIFMKLCGICSTVTRALDSYAITPQMQNITNKRKLTNNLHGIVET